MQTFYQIMGIVSAIIILYFLYQTIKNRPDLFTKENMNKSIFTMGLLGVGLIGFVALLIIVLRYT
jgi:uncharacterized membrane protein